MCIVTGCYAVCDVIDLVNYLSFLIKTFSYIPESQKKKLITQEGKELLLRNKHFSSF